MLTTVPSCSPYLFSWLLPEPRRPEGLYVLPQAGAQLRPLSRLGLHWRRPERLVRLAELSVRVGAQRASNTRVWTQGQQEHLPRGRPHLAEVISLTHTHNSHFVNHHLIFFFVLGSTITPRYQKVSTSIVFSTKWLNIKKKNLSRD